MRARPIQTPIEQVVSTWCKERNRALPWFRCLAFGGVAAAVMLSLYVIGIIAVPVLVAGASIVALVICRLAPECVISMDHCRGRWINHWVPDRVLELIDQSAIVADRDKDALSRLLLEHNGLTWSHLWSVDDGYRTRLERQRPGYAALARRQFNREEREGA